MQWLCMCECGRDGERKIVNYSSSRTCGPYTYVTPSTALSWHKVSSVMFCWSPKVVHIDFCFIFSSRARLSLSLVLFLSLTPPPAFSSGPPWGKRQNIQQYVQRRIQALVFHTKSAAVHSRCIRGQSHFKSIEFVTGLHFHALDHEAPLLMCVARFYQQTLPSPLWSPCEQ